MTNTLNTGLTTATLLAAKVDSRLTVKRSGIEGADFLAIGDKVMFTVFIYRSKTVRLYATVEGDSIVFKGGLFGEHSIAASAAITSAERVEAHWRGYVKATEDKITGRINAMFAR